MVPQKLRKYSIGLQDLALNSGLGDPSDQRQVWKVVYCCTNVKKNGHKQKFARAIVAQLLNKQTNKQL